ncbi:unnamed protein product, partial [Timema podura]|nr:unnamed protein product [Timema podura]
VPKDQPIITGVRLRYKLGETLQGNCSSSWSKPAAKLSWFINGEPVRDPGLCHTVTTGSALLLGTTRKYNGGYLNFGFTYAGPENCLIPECVVCGEKLGSDHFTGKDNNCFSRLLSSGVKQAKSMEKRKTIAEKAKLISYKVAEIVALNMQPHTIAENLILTACKQIVKSIFFSRYAAEKEVSIVPFANVTIYRRIDVMSSDIVKNITENLSDGRIFTLKLDESTDISQKYLVLTHIRFVDNGAPTTTERFKGLIARLKQESLNVGSIHCLIHRESLVVKTLPAKLKSVSDTVIKMVNYTRVSRGIKRVGECPGNISSGGTEGSLGNVSRGGEVG